MKTAKKCRFYRFFFEGDQGNVLYTGDIRMTVSDLRLMPVLHKSNKFLDFSLCRLLIRPDYRVKHLKSLYFDSTFCSKNTISIPSREKSRDCVLKLARDWLTVGRHRKVFLHTAAKYGQEFLFCELSAAFKMKVFYLCFKTADK